MVLFILRKFFICQVVCDKKMRCSAVVKSVSFFTLGCKVNFSESDSLSSVFKSSGYKIHDFKDLCDVYVINTCAVTAESERKSRQKIRQARNKNKSAVIAVIGCYSERASHELYDMGADVIIGTSGKSKLLPLVEEAIRRRELQKFNKDASVSCQKLIAADKSLSDISCTDCSCPKSLVKTGKDKNLSEEFEDLDSSEGGTLGRIRAVIKVQDGCDSFCTFCIIPHLRGRSRSRSFQSVLQTAENYIKRGYSELVITGINLSSYSYSDYDLMDLVESISELSDKIPADENVKDFRIRIGSLGLSSLNSKNISRLVTIPKLCNHFHLSLQSACDKTLKRMNRKYSFNDYYECLQKIRSLDPLAGITTDVIVGFPGETEDDFYESLSNIEKCQFSDIHIFPYSKRPLTAAASFDGAVSKEEKVRRAELVKKVAEESKAAFLRKNLGREVIVLFEGQGFGYTENYIKVSGDAKGFGVVTLTEENMKI